MTDEVVIRIVPDPDPEWIGCAAIGVDINGHTAVSGYIGKDPEKNRWFIDMLEILAEALGANATIVEEHEFEIANASPIKRTMRQRRKNR